MKAEDKDLNRLIDKVDRILEKELPKDVDSLIEWGEKYANQRVIEELEWVTSNKDAKETTFRALARLSNLKQTI
jgi:hypothetical protein